MPEVIGRQRYLVADSLANLTHIVDQRLDADLGELNAGEGVHDIAPLQRARRRRHRALDALQQADADVHLEEFEAGVHALFEALTHGRAVGYRVGVAVDQHLVAEFAAGQLICRYGRMLCRPDQIAPSRCRRRRRPAARDSRTA